MFLNLAHTKTEVFQYSRSFVKYCYQLTNDFPSEEKYAMVQQIRRAALSVLLNIAEGSSRTSSLERKRFYEIARGSIIEVDTAFDLAVDLKYLSEERLQIIESITISIFKQLSALIKGQITH
ncbi:MAG TPA: four helix bundle protein [Flavisolibacter sp.]|jgi:four helix bundle protein|nr:four helix bundle protein [Flavisolibacter sp.]